MSPNSIMPMRATYKCDLIVICFKAYFKLRTFFVRTQFVAPTRSFNLVSVSELNAPIRLKVNGRQLRIFICPWLAVFLSIKDNSSENNILKAACVSDGSLIITKYASLLCFILFHENL